MQSYHNNSGHVPPTPPSQQLTQRGGGQVLPSTPLNLQNSYWPPTPQQNAPTPTHQTQYMQHPTPIQQQQPMSSGLQQPQQMHQQKMQKFSFQHSAAAPSVNNLPTHCTTPYLVSKLKLNNPEQERELINTLEQLSQQYPDTLPEVLMLSFVAPFEKASPGDGHSKFVKANKRNNNCRHFINKFQEILYASNIYGVFRPYSTLRPGTCYPNYNEAVAEIKALKAFFERISERYFRFDSCDVKIDTFSLDDPTGGHSMMYTPKNGPPVRISWNIFGGLLVHHVKDRPHTYGGGTGYASFLRKNIIKDAVEKGIMTDPSNPTQPMPQDPWASMRQPRSQLPPDDAMECDEAPTSAASMPPLAVAAMPPSASDSAVAAVPPRPMAIPPSPAQNGSSTMPMRAPVTQTSSGDSTELSGLRTEFLGYLSGAAKCIKDQSELSNQQSKDMGNLMKAVGAMNLKQEQFERNQQELLNNQQNDRKNQNKFQAEQRQTNEDRIFFEDQQRQTNENRIVFEDRQRQTNENNSQEISELKSSNAALRSANDDLSSRVRSLELQQASTPSQRTSAASPFGANGSTQATPQVNASAQAPASFPATPQSSGGPVAPQSAPSTPFSMGLFSPTTSSTAKPAGSLFAPPPSTNVQSTSVPSGFGFAAPETQSNPTVAPSSPSSKKVAQSYKEGQQVVYTDSQGSTSAIIKKIHLDDKLVAYYTIEVHGREKQTDDAHLSVITASSGFGFAAPKTPSKPTVAPHGKPPVALKPRRTSTGFQLTPCKPTSFGINLSQDEINNFTATPKSTPKRSAKPPLTPSRRSARIREATALRY